jgi:hypothetical protein
VGDKIPFFHDNKYLFLIALTVKIGQKNTHTEKQKNAGVYLSFLFVVISSGLLSALAAQPGENAWHLLPNKKGQAKNAKQKMYKIKKNQKKSQTKKNQAKSSKNKAQKTLTAEKIKILSIKAVTKRFASGAQNR